MSSLSSWDMVASHSGDRGQRIPCTHYTGFVGRAAHSPQRTNVDAVGYAEKHARQLRYVLQDGSSGVSYKERSSTESTWTSWSSWCSLYVDSPPRARSESAFTWQCSN